jgi:hypothetical protein
LAELAALAALGREVVDMSFVHGHARATGWVMAHLRRPTRPEPGQLPLLPGALALRLPEDPDGSAEGARGAEPLTSARKSAITCS